MIWITLIIIIALTQFGLLATAFKTFIGILSAIGIFMLWVAGVGDINGDGKADLIWHNRATGQVYAMLLNVTTVIGGTIIHTEPDTNWDIVTVGDLNNDGKADILWQNAVTGQVYQMELNGLSVSKGVMIYQEPNTAWHIQGETEWRDKAYGVGVTTTK